jgi:phospholipid transport system substrate-binding protein
MKAMVRCAERRATRMRELTMTVSTSSRLRSSIAASALLLSIIATPSIAGAASSAVDPTTIITDLGTQGIQSLGQAATSAERIARLGTLFRQDFDINGIGLFALGSYRRVATPAEQQEFFRLYPEFTVRAFHARLNDYRGAPFRVTGQRVVGNETIVSSEILPASGGRVQVDWHLADNGGQYRVTDVAIGGISMKVALRDQFASWVANNGGRFNALLAVMRQQIARQW